MAKIGCTNSETLTFKSVINRHTDRRQVKSEPHQTSYVIEDLEHILAPWKLLGIRQPTWSAENLGKPDPLYLKPP